MTGKGLPYGVGRGRQSEVQAVSRDSVLGWASLPGLHPAPGRAQPRLGSRQPPRAGRGEGEGLRASGCLGVRVWRGP